MGLVERKVLVDGTRHADWMTFLMGLIDRSTVTKGTVVDGTRRQSSTC